MIDADDEWVWAVGAVVAGIVVGAVLGWSARRWLGSEQRRPALRAIAAPASVFLFWLSTAAGVVFAIGATSPDSLEPIPRDIIEWLPNVLIAGFLVLGGYAAGIALSTAVGRALSRATGQQHAVVERTIRWVVVAGTAILALSQLGVRTTILTVVIAGVVFAVAATFTLLAGLGGRDVASHIAANRTLRGELRVGDRIVAADREGVIVALNPTTLAVQTADNRRVLIPYGLLLDQPFEVSPSRR